MNTTVTIATSRSTARTATVMMKPRLCMHVMALEPSSVKRPVRNKRSWKY